MRVLFAGPSGIGKTTEAKRISDKKQDLFFVSGSYRDLIPGNQGLTHQQMLEKDPKVQEMEDFQILNLRKKSYIQFPEMVSDRSPLDLAAYFMYKQAKNIPQCEMEHFLELCKMVLNTYCSHLIFLPLEEFQLREWITEDNEKRITSNYFQIMITKVMYLVLDLWDFESKEEITIPSFGKGRRVNIFAKPFPYGATLGEISSIYGKTKVFICRELNKDNRENIINRFLGI